MTEALRVLHVGWVSSSFNFIYGLYNSGYELALLDSEPEQRWQRLPGALANVAVTRLYTGVEKRHRLFEYRTRYLRTLFARELDRWRWSDTYSRRVEEVLSMYRPDVVIGSWGSAVLPEMSLIRGVAPRLPIVHNLVTFPVSQGSRLRQLLELRLWRRITPGIHGVIYPTDRMRTFLTTRYPQADSIPSIVRPEGFCGDYYFNRRSRPLQEEDGEPHLVFVGQFDPKYSINLVGGQLREIAERGIHVHLSADSGMTTYPERMHPFEYFGPERILGGEFADFMNQFDACLVVYNVKRRTARYETSLPSRFLIALAAGLPVCLPGGLLASVEDCVRTHEIGIVYDSVDELAQKVREREQLARMRRNAERYGRELMFENNLDSLKGLISLVCNEQPR